MSCRTSPDNATIKIRLDTLKHTRNTMCILAHALFWTLNSDHKKEIYDLIDELERILKQQEAKMNNDIGNRIRALRTRAGLTQAELGRRIGMFPAPINNIENGKHLPSVKVLLAVCDVLDCTPNDILLTSQANDSYILSRTADFIRRQVADLRSRLNAVISDFADEL